MTEAKLSPTKYKVVNVRLTLISSTVWIIGRSLGIWLDDLEDREHTIRPSTMISPLILVLTLASPLAPVRVIVSLNNEFLIQSTFYSYRFAHKNTHSPGNPEMALF